MPRPEPERSDLAESVLVIPAAVFIALMIAIAGGIVYAVCESLLSLLR